MRAVIAVAAGLLILVAAAQTATNQTDTRSCRTSASAAGNCTTPVAAWPNRGRF